MFHIISHPPPLSLARTQEGILRRHLAAERFAAAAGFIEGLLQRSQPAAA